MWPHHTIRRAYTRRYTDTGQCKAYVEWSDGSRTEGEATRRHNPPRPEGSHMQALFARATSEGRTIEHEQW